MMNRFPSCPSRSVRRNAEMWTVRLAGPTKTLGQTRAIRSCLLISSPGHSADNQDFQRAASQRHWLVSFQQKKLRREQAKRSE